MARTELEHVVLPSLLDRLTDREPAVAIDRIVSREESERDFRRGVARDVELLLNTRRTMEPAPPGLAEVRRSVYEFGIPDTTGMPVGTEDGRARLLESMRDALQRFEPRLTNVRVKIVDADQVKSPQVRFLVEAMLIMDRERQKVFFDTLLEVANGEYDVSATDAPPPSP